MPDLTPKALRDHVLRAVGELSGMVVSKPVKAAEIVALAVERAGISPADADDHKKACANANWVGTQALRAAGLLGPADKRGWWVLLPAGAAALRGDGAPEVAEVAEVADAPTGQLSLPPPIPPAVVRSEWADDTAGVAVFSTPVQDSYAEDPYIRSLAISQTPCFGAFSEDDATCGACPISRSCRSTLFVRLHAIGDTLRQRDEVEAARRVPKVASGAAPSVVRSEESIDDVLDDLENAGPTPVRTPPPADETGVELPTPVESICYKCSKVIREGTVAIVVVGLGSRHKVCP